MENREAIEWLKGSVVSYEVDNKGRPNGNITCDLTQEVLDMAISALEKQEKERWIPVTERLPEIKHHIDDEHFSDEVLVTEWFNGFKKTRIGNFDTRTGWWNDEKGCGFLGVITSWRPLPEPYTEEDNDKP